MYARFDIPFKAFDMGVKLLEVFDPPVLALINKKDISRIEGRESVYWTTANKLDGLSLEEIKRKIVVFAVYESKRETLPLELAWQQAVKNNSIVYVKFNEKEKK